jgi:peptidoglycan/xylan/chitin deacetylase (PgdA/CDA1 family)
LRALPRSGFRFIVIRLELLLIYSVLILMLVLQVGLGVTYDRVLRAYNGVARGVKFEGTDVSRLYRDELYAVVERFAANSGLRLVPAMTGGASAGADLGQPGVLVDVEATVQRILRAQPGSDVDAVTVARTPAPDPATAKEIRHVDTRQKAVAFAVNVAWGDEFIEPMLALFRNSGARVSFFIVGTWAKQRPDLVRRMAEDGHEIANHGFEHVHVQDAHQDAIKKLIEDNRRLLYSITGCETRVFSPPYGEVNPNIVRAAAEAGHFTSMWDIDTIDWQRPSPQVITSRIFSKVRPGSIILMHPTEPTVQALLDILARLTSEGYRVVTVSELIEAGQ